MIRVLIGGVAAGLVAGLFGVGGGILLVPVLVLWLGSPQHEAHATSLVAVTLAAVAGATRFAMDDAVSLPGAVALAAGALPAARLGADLLPRIPESRLRTAFGVLAVGLSVRFLVAGAGGDAAAGISAPALDAGDLAIHVAGGLVAGLVSSLMGVGGGVVLVPVLTLALGYDQHVAEGTSLAVIVPTALVGAWQHGRNGLTQWSTGLRLGLATIIGSVTGASIALGVSPDVLARGFGVLLAIVGARILNRSRGRAGAPSPPGDGHDAGAG